MELKGRSTMSTLQNIYLFHSKSNGNRKLNYHQHVLGPDRMYYNTSSRHSILIRRDIVYEILWR